MAIAWRQELGGEDKLFWLPGWWMPGLGSYMGYLVSEQYAEN